MNREAVLVVHHSLGMNTAHFELNIHIFIDWDLSTKALEENNGNGVASRLLKMKTKPNSISKPVVWVDMWFQIEDVTDIAAQLLYTIRRYIQ